MFKLAKFSVIQILREITFLQVAGRGLKQGKEMASKTAEYIAENTYHYTEEAKKLAAEHMEVALQHWRTKMGEKWTLPRSLSNLAEGSKSGETNANPKQVKPQDRPIGEFRSREPGFKSGWGHKKTFL